MTKCQVFQAGAFAGVGSHLFGALSQKGFAYLVGHGVPAAQVDEMFRASDEFFGLPQVCEGR